MTDNPFGMDDPERWVQPTHTAEVDPEAKAAYYDAKPLTRCQTCWNVLQCCTCLGQRVSPIHSDHPSVAGISPEARDRLLHEYAERGIAQIEQVINGGG